VLVVIVVLGVLGSCLNDTSSSSGSTYSEDRMQELERNYEILRDQ
jgi:hypothetical protein